MELQESYTFEAPVSTVWDALTDAEKVAHCLPGCEKFEPLGEDRYKATLSIGIGAIRGRYQGTVAITEKQVNNFYKIVVDGRGSPGSVKGEASVSLHQDGEKTLVGVTAEVQVTGTIARVGQRLMGRASQMLMDSFFDCMRKTVEEA